MHPNQFKLSSFHVARWQYGSKSELLITPGVAATLTFDLSTSKSNQLIFVPKSIKVVNLTKFRCVHWMNGWTHLYKHAYTWLDKTERWWTFWRLYISYLCHVWVSHLLMSFLHNIRNDSARRELGQCYSTHHDGTNPDPVGKTALKLLLKGVFDLNHITFTARDNDTNKSLVVCSKTFHRFLHLLCKVARLLSDHSHCQVHNRHWTE